MDYAQQIVTMYEDEMYGGHQFSQLCDRASDAEVAQMWRRVADVERLAGEWLAPLATRFGADLDSLSRSGLEHAARQAAEFEGQSTTEILEYYCERVPANVDRVTALIERVPREDQGVLAQYIAHSKAFLACAGHWLNGDRSHATLVCGA